MALDPVSAVANAIGKVFDFASTAKQTNLAKKQLQHASAVDRFGMQRTEGDMIVSAAKEDAKRSQTTFITTLAVIIIVSVILIVLASKYL